MEVKLELELELWVLGVSTEKVEVRSEVLGQERERGWDEEEEEEWGREREKDKEEQKEGEKWRGRILKEGREEEVVVRRELPSIVEELSLEMEKWIRINLQIKKYPLCLGDFKEVFHYSCRFSLAWSLQSHVFFFFFWLFTF